MSFQKYLQIINAIDPGKIYVESIRSILKVSTLKARTICEMAVQDNLFLRKVGVICPNDGRIIEEYEKESQIPEHITCKICELEDVHPCTFETKDLKTVIFYKLNS
jgi:hypothetical protein